MNIKTLFVRFYKSFNFDYLRKYDSRVSHNTWDKVDGLYFPYVKIPIDGKVTAIVGANESGKSHLLTAIKIGLSGEEIANEDMCRYSEFYTVEKGKRKVPDFGFEFDNLKPEEKQVVAPILKVKPEDLKSFYFFRTQTKIELYLQTAKGEEQTPIILIKDKDKDAEKIEKLQNILPRPFEIKSDIALPSSVPLTSLFDHKTKYDSFQTNRNVRAKAFETLSEIAKNNINFFDTKEIITQNAEPLFGIMQPLKTVLQTKLPQKEVQKRNEEIKLARDLICNIAKVDPKALEELYISLKEGKDGHASGLIDNINNQLATALNFPNWWVQDKEFELIVSPREVDLVFTIKDRTGTQYSFSERSNGLKYFLSYYVQYLAHEPLKDVIEILTMDEPDAFLSSQAQQDLLKIFESFAEPATKGVEPIQVVYVTHSPFLIDKNHAERILVLEKGASEEGTRVVKDISRHHYEPLRSAFGAFVGETVLIGNTNLFVEGISDQVILAGAANFIRKKSVLVEDEVLDLNRLTIVPAQGASHIPYMVYLARGRDIEKPPVIVMLDSDVAGTEAKKALEKGGPRGKQALPKEFVFQLGDLVNENENLTLPTGNLNDIEDLIPISLCVLAIKEYLTEFCGADENLLNSITSNLINEKIAEVKNLFNAIETAVKSLSGELYIEKVGFARSFADVLNKIKNEVIELEDESDLTNFETNMKILFSKINQIKRKAERDFTAEKVSIKVDRLKKAFIRDHPESANRQLAYVLFEGIEDSLDDSLESDSIRTALNRARRDFTIDTERHLPINNYEEFKNTLEKIRYAAKQNTQSEL